ncbi:MAG: chitobiase/beta-hexosaminidase C-terminal domain-containing protein, partial [Planctomycetes bacterium]|nr:chitobiase/beta-hexosaminidase C-terminal domain-containing protein [Planctomycetota bacterium]
MTLDRVPVVTVDRLVTNDTTPRLSGTVDDPAATVDIRVDGRTYRAVNDQDGTWRLPNNRISPPLAETLFDVQATATDPGGRVGVDSTLRELTVGPAVIISEFMADNNNTLVDFEGDPSDWIELLNIGSDLDGGGLQGWFLTDNPDNLTKWEVPVVTPLVTNEQVLIFASGKDLVSPAGELHTNFQIGSGGEYLALVKPDGTTIAAEFADAPNQREDVSYGIVDAEARWFPTPTPGTPNNPGVIGFVRDTAFSIDRGFFIDPFVLEITSPTPGAVIRYTLDRSIPTTTTGEIYDGPITIDRTTSVRAFAFKPDYAPTNVDTQTYLFTADVIEQSTISSTIRNNPTWGPQLEDSLLALPTISLVAPTFNPSSVQTEKPTSVELIFPDGTEGFQLDAGVEHFGGHTLSNSPKKNMRIVFKAIYGPTKLRYDLFGEGAVDEFDKILLRTGSHDSFFWTHPTNRAASRGVYFRGRWMSDRQLDMGQLAPRGRFVHVYVNGVYWGQHQLMERPDNAFMASYLGGDESEYDAVNAGSAIDCGLPGSPRCSVTQAIYGRLLSSTGNWETLQLRMDVENYIDYMLLQFYGGNDWDWNTSQNWTAATEREGGDGFKFFSWDSDLILRTRPNANVVSRGGPGNMWGSIIRHEEFKMLLADRAQKYFFNDGILTADRVIEQWDELASRIELSMIAETARWGNQSNYTPTSFTSAVNDVESWIIDPPGEGSRTSVVIGQLKAVGMFPNTVAPTLLIDGTKQFGGEVFAGARLSLASSDGVIYVTLDGSDPRLIGGDVNPDALVYAGEKISLLESTQVKARVR